MKRIQVILEQWHHTWLTEQAKAEKKTMSALLRELLTEAIERKEAATWQDDPIWGIVGLGHGPDDGIISENLDDFLYSLPASQPVHKIAERPNEDETDSSGH